MPEPARDGIHNALDNLNAPVVLVNDVLQGDGDKASNTFGRFMINSTVGVAGLIDVAAKMGIPGHANDFGITLGKWGAAEGSYLVLPFAGPKPPRDLAGDVVDIGFDPLTYVTWNNSTLYMIVRTGLGVLDSRAANIDAVEASNVPRSISTPPPAACIARTAPRRSMTAKRPIRICRIFDYCVDDCACEARRELHDRRCDA